MMFSFSSRQLLLGFILGFNAACQVGPDSEDSLTLSQSAVRAAAVVQVSHCCGSCSGSNKSIYFHGLEWQKIIVIVFCADFTKARTCHSATSTSSSGSNFVEKMLLLSNNIAASTTYSQSAWLPVHALLPIREHFVGMVKEM